MKRLTLFLLIAALVGGALGSTGCGSNTRKKLHGAGGDNNKPVVNQPGNPAPGSCGDNKWETSEACDLTANGGKNDGNSGCTATCTVVSGWECDRTKGTCSSKATALCGDGSQTFSEECDLTGFNKQNGPGTGCTNDCKIEKGWSCDRDTGKCQKLCGNGKRDSGEECDLGKALNGSSGCTAECKTVDGYECGKSPTNQDLTICKKKMPDIKGCGNGKVEGAEECDLGSLNDSLGSGCTKECKASSGFKCTKTGSKSICQKVGCGNSTVEGTEQCDLGDQNKGEYGGCRKDCTWAPKCGDGIVQAAFGEQCDDANTDPNDGCSACKLTADSKPTPDSKGRLVPGKLICPTTGGACKPNLCGNGTVEAGESCDDGNRKSDDGCDATCQIERGYDCPSTGGKCKVKACGDGVRIAPEECDDGNSNDNDGCDRYCQIEPGFKCSKDNTGKDTCVKTMCGNGVLELGEECDDHNTTSGDGCDSQCKLEPGYKFVSSTGAVDTARCGDNIVEGYETCDPPGQGCSTTCRMERKSDGTNAYCPVDTQGKTIGGACTYDTKNGVGENTCGNGKVEGTEQCDDGNRIGGDGCDDQCQAEGTWQCRKSVVTGKVKCSSVCGDGKKGEGEECDDGNLANGDGCSSTCKIEKNWTCQSTADAEPKTITIPMRIRDVKGEKDDGGISDFELEAGAARGAYSCSGNVKGIVKDRLGADGKPVLGDKGYDCMAEVHPPAGCAIGSNKQDPRRKPCKDEHFSWWYHDDPLHKHNYPIKYDLVLTKDNASGAYVFDSSKDTKHGGMFFPLDGPDPVKKPKEALGFGITKIQGSCKVHNYSFTTEFRTYFKYDASKKYSLSFSGDDDLWVFINGRLALDLGGEHSAENGNVTINPETNRKNGALYNTKYNMYDKGVYELAVFHAERHSCASNYKITLQGFLNTSKSVCTTKCGDGLRLGKEQCDLGTKNGTDSGCSEECTINPGYVCYLDKGVEKCQKSTTCGNGKIDGYEECDPGKDSNGVIRTDDPYCNSNCTFRSCGNGVKEGQEECDGGDNCTPRCKKDTCGNGIVGTSEQCDDGNKDEHDYCTNQCKLAICGDGIQGPGEACDDGAKNGNGYNQCLPNCSRRAHYCGDGVVDAQDNEECDAPGNPSCTDKCKWAEVCGDGILTPNEECDDGNAKDGDGCDNDCRITNGYRCVKNPNASSADPHAHPASLCEVDNSNAG